MVIIKDTNEIKTLIYSNIKFKNTSLLSNLESFLKHSGPIPVSIEDGTVSGRLHLPLTFMPDFYKIR